MNQMSPQCDSAIGESFVAYTFVTATKWKLIEFISVVSLAFSDTLNKPKYVFLL